MPEYPSGTVTFLFTDIQGSTRLWERDSEMMRRVVDRHLQILGECVREQNGVHFKTVGDAIQAAFHTPADAVRAAVTGQRRLQSSDWPETGPLLVRMAIHAGPAAPVSGDYLAPCLNRLARLLGTGWGGQILLTDLIRRQLHELPDGVTVQELGRHRLRDLLEPEQVSQLVIEGLPAAFPPLKSLEGFPSNLPRQANALIGRAGELAQLTRMLVDERASLVTLTGPAGSGKTRLALQAGADMLDAFEDGVWFVALGPVTDASLFLPTIAGALGVREGSGQSLEAQLLEYLAQRRLLLILDNFEHLPGAAVSLGALLAGCSHLQALVTSRRVLRLQAEQVLPLAPLPLPMPGKRLSVEEMASIPSVALFLERAQAREPAFVLTEDTAQAIAGICTRLDGLPLALELAAAQAPGLTPEDLLAELDDRFALLTSGPVDLLPHQQTLETAIAWSYDRLAPPAQAVFRRLSTFRGGISRSAAETVVTAAGSPGAKLTPVLLELVTNSLLRKDEEATPARYTMLESLRAFGDERLHEHDEAAATQEAHARVFLALANDAAPHLTGPDQQDWFVRFRTEHDNLRAGLEWSLSAPDGAVAIGLVQTLWRFWNVHGILAEGRRWVEAVIARFDHDDPLPAPVFLAAGTLASSRGDLAAAKSWLEVGLARAREAADQETEAAILHNAGNVALGMGDHRGAEALFDASLAVFRDLGDRWREAHVLSSQGAIAHNRGDLATAEARYSEALAIWDDAGDLRRVAAILANLTLLLSPLPERRTQARAYGERCLVEARRLQYPIAVAAALTGLGYVNASEGELEAAETCFAESLEVSQQADDRIGVATAQGNLALVVSDRGDVARAAALALESLAAFVDIGDDIAVSSTLEMLALIAAASAQFEAAIRLHGAADAAREVDGVPPPIALAARHDASLALLHAALPESFSRCWDDGRALSVQEAMALFRSLKLASASPSARR